MAIIELVTLVRCSVERLFDLELDMEAHSASLAASGETATTSMSALIDSRDFCSSNFEVFLIL